MKILAACTIALLILGSTQGISGQGIELFSPDGTIKTTVLLRKNSNLSYTVSSNGKMVIDSSSLGINLNKTDLGRQVKLGAPTFQEHADSYPVIGVHATAINHYRSVTIPVVHQETGIRFQLEVRAFDNGMAYRYIVPHRGLSTITGEASSWKVPTGSKAWFQENVFYYEGLFMASDYASLGRRKIGPPLTFQTPDGIYVLVSEAALYNYSGMSLQSDGHGLLQAAFVNDPKGWTVKDTIVSPWRLAIISKDLNGLVNADLIQNLNPAPEPALANAKWIKPGRATWSYFEHENVTTMDLERHYVDKAAALGFEYNMVDAGWEWSWPNCMDSLKALVAYAAKKNVGIWVWKSYSEVKEAGKRKAFFESLHHAGVLGVKIDFIDQEAKEQVAFYPAALQDAAASRLMVNFHGANKPTGYNRSFPNELTREAIYGQEWTTYSPQAPISNCITPFTRLVVGPADYTPGVFDSKRAYGTSRANQLALQIIFNSVLSCWPSDPDQYLSSDALALIRSMPTTWDETIVLPVSRIGETVVFARRKANTWFLGGIISGKEKRFQLPLDFLSEGNYAAQILQDDLTNSDHVLYSRSSYHSGDSILLLMKGKGGFAASFTRTSDNPPRLRIQPESKYLYGPAEVMIRSGSQEEIRYTTDGTNPTAVSTVYTGPIRINASTIVKAAVFNKEKAELALATAQYLLPPAPQINAQAGIFLDKKTLLLEAGQEPGQIHYTLNGTVPTLTSAVYKDSLQLTASAKLRAKIFYASGMSSEMLEADFTKVDPAPAIPVGKLYAGLTANYYEGKWDALPDFHTISAKQKTRVAAPDLHLVKTRQEHYAIRFSGYINIPITGVYRFYVLSDDGSQVYIDRQLLVDNDGNHGDLEKSGEMALSAGPHEIAIHYYQNGSGQSLTVYLEGGGMEKKIIPAAILHTK